MAVIFNNPWSKGNWETDKWFDPSETAVENAIIPQEKTVTSEEIASAAESLGADTLMMESYQKFQDGTFTWFFSKNPNLAGKYKNVQSLKTWKGWKTLNTQQKQVIGDLAGVDLNALGETEANLKKLIGGFEKWRQELYAVFWAGASGSTWTCNIFVGEALYWAGKNAVVSGKYYAAAKIHSNSGPFKEVKPENLKRGNIVTFHNGGHTEIVTKTPVKHLIADDGFCSIGAGRDDGTIGIVKCDSASDPFDTREINNSSNKYHTV